MLLVGFIFVVEFLMFQSIETHRIELDVTSIGSPYKFELSSNNSKHLDRDVLLGLVESATSSIPSTIRLQANYDHVKVQRPFSFTQSDDKTSNQTIEREPIFRSHLLTPTFNRSYPFVRVLIASARGSYEDYSIKPVCARVTAINGRNVFENQVCYVSPKTGQCLVTISLLKMLENQNQTTTKVELYLKVKYISREKCHQTHWRF